MCVTRSKEWNDKGLLRSVCVRVCVWACVRYDAHVCVCVRACVCACPRVRVIVCNKHRGRYAIIRMPACLSVCLPACICLCLYVCLSVCLFVFPILLILSVLHGKSGFYQSHPDTIMSVLISLQVLGRNEIRQDIHNHIS